MNKSLYIFIYFISIVHGQTNGYIPDAYNYFFKNTALYNPSYISEEGLYDFSLTHKLLNGQLRDLSYTNFLAAKNIKKEKNDMSFKLILAREQEGPYISIPKIGLSYAYQIKIRKNLHLSSGINLGGTGVYFSTTSVNASFYLPDGSIGIGLKSKKIYWGASALQIFNSSKNNFTLKRHFNSIFSYQEVLAKNWKIQNHLFSTIATNFKSQLKYAMVFSYNEFLDFGWVIRSRKVLSFLTSIYVPTGKNTTTLSFIYNTNYARTNSYFIPNSMELMLAIKLNNDKI